MVTPQPVQNLEGKDVRRDLPWDDIYTTREKREKKNLQMTHFQPPGADQMPKSQKGQH